MSLLRTYGPYVLGALLILGMAALLDNEGYGKPRWTVPYFSGAANYTPGQGWRINPADIETFAALPDHGAREAYRFKRAAPEALVAYNFQTIGYMYVAWVARALFFWQGDLRAVESLQLVVHLLLTFLVMGRLKRRSSKVLFFVLYGLNPLMLYMATTPYYRYWPAVASAPVAFYLLDAKRRVGWAAGLGIAVLLGLMYAVRPTVLLIGVFFCALVALRGSKVLGVACLGVYLFSGLVLFNGNDHIKNPWFAAYVGVGGYPNPYMDLPIADASGYVVYERQTGDAMIKNGQLDLEAFNSDAFWVAIKEAYLDIVQTHPLMLLRNALLNFFQAFSLGYFTKSLYLSYLSALGGALYFGLLLWHRQFWFILAIAASALTFTPYYVPTQAIMFGTFLLLVSSALAVLQAHPGFDAAFEAVLRKFRRNRANS